MKTAIHQATLARTEGEVPIGAVIIDAKKEIIALGRNMTRSLNDPTAHAEIIAIRRACKHLNSSRLIGCSMYVTIEPCPMCASAISAAYITNLFYGASDPKSGGIETGPRIFTHEQSHYKTNVFSGFREEETRKLMKEFFLSLRMSNQK